MELWCTQCSLAIITSIFTLAGLALFIFGCLVKFGSVYLEDYIQDLMSGTLAFIRSAGSEGNMANFDLGVYLGMCAYVVMGVGACLLFVSVFGCCGSVRRIRCFLVFYAAVVVFMLLAELAVGVAVVAFPEQAAEVIKQPLYGSLRTKYRGINSSDVTSVGWNFFMVTFRCCGVMGYDDFQFAKQWDNKVTLQGEPVNENFTTDSPPITVILTTPIACCKTIGAFPQVTLPQINNITCAISPNEMNSNMNQGCIDSVLQVIKEHYAYIAIITVTVVILQMTTLIIVVRLLQAIDRSRVYNKEVQRMFSGDFVGQ